MTVLRLFAVAVLFGLAVVPARADDEKARVEMIQKASRAVFRIAASGGVESLTGAKVEGGVSSSGTGFLIEEGGQLYVVTNHHVISLKSGQRWKAGGPRIIGSSPALLVETTAVELELVGADELTDLAVLRFRKPLDILKPNALTFAKPDTFKLGQSVVAIGYPRAQAGGASASVGVISGLNRSVKGGLFGGLVQTDAAVNRGNSGGPLLNLRGEVVGVNTYGYGNPTKTEKIDVPIVKADGKGGLVVDGYKRFEVLSEIDVTEGMNYARSSESAVPIVRQLIKTGAIKRPDLGFTATTLAWDGAQVYDLSEGALVVGVARTGPAATAAVEAGPFDVAPEKLEQGLKPCDVVHEIRWSSAQVTGAARVRSQGDLLNALAQVPPGSKIELNVSRVTPKLLKVIEEALAKGWLQEGGGKFEDAKATIGFGERKRNAVVKFTLPAP